MRPQEDIFLKRLVKTGEKYPKCSCLNVSNSLNSYISHNAAQCRLLFTTSLTYNRPARWFVTQNDLETVWKKGSRHFHKKYFFEYTKPTFLESRCQTSVSLSSKKKKKRKKNHPLQTPTISKTKISATGSCDFRQMRLQIEHFVDH